MTDEISKIEDEQKKVTREINELQKRAQKEEVKAKERLDDVEKELEKAAKVK
ncbi:hypothetical protein GW793_03550 [bacterium]|nr:hypothetical protein [bacterium]